jgi:hypothetical protein
VFVQKYGRFMGHAGRVSRQSRDGSARHQRERHTRPHVPVT